MRILLLITIIILSPALRVVLYQMGYTDQVNHGFFAASDALATGCLLALLWGKLPSWIESRWIGLTSGLFALLPLISLDMRIVKILYNLLGFFVLNLGIAIFMAHSVKRAYLILNARPVIFLGTMSYSIYLVQQPFLNPYIKNMSLGLRLSLVMVAALISHFVIEKPFLRLREIYSRRNIPASLSKET